MPQGDVHVGRDGWLFLVGGTNRVLSQYRPSPARWWRLLRWRRRVLARERRAARLGIRCLHLVVPEKLAVYGDRVDGLAFDPAQAPCLRLGALLREAGAGGWIDVARPYHAARDETDLYKRTDTHWTFEGCRLAATAVLHACGVADAPSFADRPFTEVRRVGDLGAKLDPPHAETMRDHRVARDAVRVHANALLAQHEARGTAESLHVGAHVIYRNDAADADPRTLVLFGDSCAHFAPIGLTIMLAETFREVHFVWSAGLDWGYVERVRPDILLVEMAERFLARVHADHFDLERGAAARLAALGPASPASNAGVQA